MECGLNIPSGNVRTLTKHPYGKSGKEVFDDRNMPAVQIDPASVRSSLLFLNLSERLKRKAMFQMIGGCVFSALAFFIFCVFIYSDIRPYTDYGMLMSGVFLVFILLSGTAGFFDLKSAFQDLNYEKQIMHYPVGIIKHFEPVYYDKRIFGAFIKTAVQVNYTLTRDYIRLNEELFLSVETWYLSAYPPAGMTKKHLTAEEIQKAELALHTRPQDSPKATLSLIISNMA